MIRQRLDQISERINGLSLRERALLLLAVLAVIFLFWDSFVMNPLRQRQASVQTELEQVRERTAEVTASIQLMATRPDDDEQQRLLQREQALSDEIAHLQQRLDQEFEGAVSPQHAVAVLAGLLEGQSGLSVTEVENLAAEPLSGPNGAEVSAVFVHRIRVVVEGDHASLRRYLQRVEGLPRGVFLESLELSVPEWPTNRIELMFYSLTLDERWLGV